jgi:hypothetical protein
MPVDYNELLPLDQRPKSRFSPDGNTGELYDSLGEEERQEFVKAIKAQNEQRIAFEKYGNAVKTEQDVEGVIPEDVDMSEALIDSFIRNLFYVLFVLLGLFLLILTYRLTKRAFKYLKSVNWLAVKTRVFAKANNYKDRVVQLVSSLNSKDEIIIVSIILGVIVGLILGFTLGGTEAVQRASKSGSLYYTQQFAFNYLIGISSFALTAGLSYLVLKRRIE